MSDYARELWTEGCSASEVSVRIFETYLVRFTRNAVIGKVHRMGLTRRGTVSCKARNRTNVGAGMIGFDRKRKPRKPIRTSSDALKAVRRFAGSQGMVDTPPDEYDRRVPGCTIHKLEDGDMRCRWVLSEDPRHPDHRYCGEGKIPGLPYCMHHAKRAYPKVAEAMKPKLEQERESELV